MHAGRAGGGGGGGWGGGGVVCVNLGTHSYLSCTLLT